MAQYCNSSPSNKKSAVKGVLTKSSHYSVKETMDRLVVFLQRHDITIYARINRQVELNWFDMHIRPFEYILCGNPVASESIIEKNPVTALDLPLRIISWEDTDSKCWVAYKDPEYLMSTYTLTHEDTIWLDLENIIYKALSANTY